MNDSRADSIREVNLAISLAEAALAQCDKAGFIFAAIDVSCALDKLRAIREGLLPHNH